MSPQDEFLETSHPYKLAKDLTWRRLEPSEGGRAGGRRWKFRHNTDGTIFELDMKMWVAKTEKERKRYARDRMEDARKKSSKSSLAGVASSASASVAANKASIVTSDADSPVSANLPVTGKRKDPPQPQESTVPVLLPCPNDTTLIGIIEKRLTGGVSSDALLPRVEALEDTLKLHPQHPAIKPRLWNIDRIIGILDTQIQILEVVLMNKMSHDKHLLLRIHVLEQLLELHPHASLEKRLWNIHCKMSSEGCYSTSNSKYSQLDIDVMLRKDFNSILNNNQ